MSVVVTFTFNPYLENTYLIYNEQKECIIVDPGCYTPAEKMKLGEFIMNNNLKPIRLLNTHCHIDHVLGNKWVYDTYNLKPEYHKGETFVLEAVTDYAPTMGMLYDVSPLAEKHWEEGEILTLGDEEFDIYFTPGHSPASLSFYNKKENYLIAGDVLFQLSIGRTDLPGGDYHTLIKSIKEKLFVLPDDCIVYPGHGPTTTIGFEKINNPFLNEKQD